MPVLTRSRPRLDVFTMSLPALEPRRPDNPGVAGGHILNMSTVHMMRRAMDGGHLVLVREVDTA